MDRFLIGFLNIIIPLLFFVSIILVIYGVNLLTQSVKQSKKELKSKALKIGIPSLIYLIVFLTFMIYFKKDRDIKMIPKIAGLYVYRVDSLESKFLLNNDHKFNFTNTRDSVSGTWKYEENMSGIYFYNTRRQNLWRSKWSNTTEKTVLKFVEDKKNIEFIKEK